ncbi:phosphatidylethanolamine-binding protein [Thelephora terrestris]|uniref:Phosphatidylethanolamine-binding protein n=1 Tax=Thelephora terrestris TaxID=56493 RepID=A0A9P6L7F5_9AGAM|nr:phosphatidylethanolamine-binding protein [Thelephora terrestris]
MLRQSQRSLPARSAWVRYTSTAQSQPETTSGPNVSSPPLSGDRKTPPSRPGTWKTRRPHINPEKPRQWNRPLAPGVLPAFDEALRYIRQDSHALRAETQYNRSVLQEAESSPNPDLELVKGLKEKLAVLEVQSEVNRPEVRWYFRNGLADVSKPVYRHLAEKKWRNDGDLDLLMERVHQMNVVPDVLPSLHPSFDLRLTFPESPSQRVKPRPCVNPRHKQVEPGVFLVSEQTRNQPTLYASVFHAETRLYTLLMVDPDVPDPERQSFTTYLHWLQPNIPLSCTTRSIEIPEAHTSYIPPHPQRGTRYHRYVLLLLPQQAPAEPLSVPVLCDADRLHFNVREFAAQYGLDGSTGGGAHLWRQVWDEGVSQVYATVLRREEPRFAVPPKPDRYAEIRGVKRYIK